MTDDDQGLRRWFGRESDGGEARPDTDAEPTQVLGDAEPTRVLGDAEPTRVVDGPRPSGRPSDEPTWHPSGSAPAHGPGFAAPAYAPPRRSPAPAYAPTQPRSAPVGVMPPARPRSRVLPAVVASALTALVVGGTAGYGGAQLADRGPVGATGATSAPPLSRPSVAPAQGAADTVAIADRVLPSTVTISYGAAGRGGTGSGFVIDDRGHVMTNNHVVEGAPGGRVVVQLQDGTRREARVVGRSPGYDLAVIRVDDPAGLPRVELGDSSQVRPGQPVVAVGAPLGLGGTVTAGIVSAVERPLSVGNQQGTDDSVAYINGIQIDAPINPGNSGGPLSDGAGRIIGVNSAILTLGGASQDAQQGNIGLGFAIPINQAVDIGNQLIERGRATIPIIGASVSGDQSAGVALSAIVPGGPAAQAGLRSGDVVEAVDGRIVRTPTELIVRIRSHRPGDSIPLRVAGRGEVRVTLGGREG